MGATFLKTGAGQAVSGSGLDIVCFLHQDRVFLHQDRVLYTSTEWKVWGAPEAEGAGAGHSVFLHQDRVFLHQDRVFFTPGQSVIH